MRLVTRAEWGAVAPTHPPSAWQHGRPEGIVVHWIGGAGSAGLDGDHARCANTVRAIQRYEMSGSAADRYNDIAYSVCVCPHGYVYEGRGWQHASAANGPATNGTLFAACYLADVGDTLSQAGADALVELAAGIGGRRAAHRDVNTTDCPGDAIAAWVHSPAFQAATPTPPPPPAPVDPNGLAALHRAAVQLSHSITSGPVLRRGDTGAAVKDVQFALVLLGQGLAIDGAFGPNTDGAVRNVQRFWKLTVDGIVGPRTRAVLGWLLGLRYH